MAINRQYHIEFYWAIANHCFSKAKIMAYEHGPVETVRDYYLSAFSIVDDWFRMTQPTNRVSLFFETFYQSQSEMVTSTGTNIEKALKSIKLEVYNKDIFWNAVLDLIINSKQVTARILKIVFKDIGLRKASLLFPNKAFCKPIRSIGLHDAAYKGLFADVVKALEVEKQDVNKKDKVSPCTSSPHAVA